VTDKYVLLVEDNPDDATLTELAFKRARVDNKLISVCDGREALHYLFPQCDGSTRDSSCMPGLILLDLNLPLVSGLDVLKELKADEDTKGIPVIVLTSSSEESDRTESNRLGASEYIRKPTGLTEFVEIVKRIEARWLRPKAA